MKKIKKKGKKHSQHIYTGIYCCLLKCPLPVIVHHCQQKDQMPWYTVWNIRKEMKPFSNSPQMLRLIWTRRIYIYTYFNMLKYLLIFHVLHLVHSMVEITPIRVRFRTPWINGWQWLMESFGSVERTTLKFALLLEWWGFMFKEFKILQMLSYKELQMLLVNAGILVYLFVGWSIVKWNKTKWQIKRK